MVVLSDSHVRQLGDLADVYRADARDMIAERIDHLGLRGYLNESDIQHLRSLVIEGGSTGAHNENLSENLVSEVFAAYARRRGGELRCESCGYHFRRVDLSTKRLRQAERVDLVLARRLHPRRPPDRQKLGAKTVLHIDHRIPRAGWGPSRIDNLAVLCAFCNSGKSIFSNSLEAISLIIASSLAATSKAASAWLRQWGFVSALALKDNSCETCGAGTDDAELTVVGDVDWFVPWQLQVQCYSCEAV